MTNAHLTRHIIAGALLAVSSAPLHSTIFNEDDRQYVSGEGSPYMPIGLVTHGTLIRTFTTGFLVDDCHVLTSQAILGYGEAPIGKRLKFQIGLGTPQRVSTSGTVVAAGGMRKDRTVEQRFERGGRNWLLLRLDQCAGKTFGHVAFATGPFSPYEFRNVQSAGFPTDRDRGKGLTIDPACSITSGRNGIWMNDCATLKGNAGSPLFRVVSNGGKPQMAVYAMQSYGFTSHQVTPLVPGWENQAIAMSVIAPQIASFLFTDANR